MLGEDIALGQFNNKTWFLLVNNHGEYSIY